MQRALYPPVTTPALRGGCYLTSIGALTYRAEEDYPRKGHPADFDFKWDKGRVLSDFAMVLITDGEGEWQFGEAEVEPIFPGDVLCIVPGQWHRYRPKKSIGWTEQWVCLRGSVAYGFMRAGTLSDKCKLLRRRGDAHLRERMQRLYEDVLQQPEVNLPSWGARALALLLEATGDGLRQRQEAVNNPDPVAVAIRFIEENAHRRIQVETVAQHCGCVRRTLERYFKTAGLATIGRVITHSKLAQAEILLRESNLLVKEIAFACGFNGVQQFILCFRREYGLSPGEWRETVLPPKAEKLK
jgi:AraC-like DNA-binding protein